MEEKLVAIVIPIYKERMTTYEQISLRQCTSILSKHHIIVIRPQKLKSMELTSPIDEYVDFRNYYFESIKGYNELMLSKDFYRTFLGRFKYILICQLDAFVFKDELVYWCKKGYDYIGAPWPPEVAYADYVKSAKEAIINWIYTVFNIKDDVNNIPHRRQVINRVGNGGFSLRRVEKCYEILQKKQVLVSKYLQNDHELYNEDIFWSIEVNRNSKIFRIPPANIARHFSIENFPERLFRANKSILPFGCHAWDKHVDFWRPFFKEFGYHI